jgi:hypothetical protein
MVSYEDTHGSVQKDKSAMKYFTECNKNPFPAICCNHHNLQQHGQTNMSDKCPVTPKKHVGCDIGKVALTFYVVESLLPAQYLMKTWHRIKKLINTQKI